MAHVAESKKKVVSEFSQLMQEYPIIAAVNMENLPTKQLQNMRASLRDRVVLRLTKRRLMLIAIEQAKKEGLEKIIPHLKGMPALLFTKESPFKLYKTLQKSKSKAPAKAGQKAPNDIIVPAGPTPFAPGPVISELAGVGIKSGIEGGKVAVKEDSLVAKEGDVISAKLASLLTRLGIEPMDVGLEVVAAFEDGTIYTKDILAVDESEYINNISQAHAWAFNLAVEAGFPTTETVTMMITKAQSQARALALEAGVLSKDVIAELLTKAAAQNSGLYAELKYEEKISAQPTDDNKEE